MKLTTDIKTESEPTTVKYCPYRGELDWQIECIEDHCAKWDKDKNCCGRA